MNTLSIAPALADQARRKASTADPSVGDVIRLFLQIEATPQKRAAKRACAESARVLERFAEAHGELRLSQCNRAVLKLWIETNPRIKSDWTRGNHAKAVLKAFNWAVDEMELIPRNPFKGVRYRQGKRGRPLTEEEFAALLSASDPAFRLVLRFCRLTGARPGEMAAARWEHVGGSLSADRAWIVLTAHKTAHHAEAKPRVIPIPPALIDPLVAGRDHAELAGHIFLNRRGRPWLRHAICLRIRRLRKRLGLPADARLYGCRHAFATAAIVNRVEIRDVAELLGHASTRMTERYLHLAGLNDRLCELARRATDGR